MDNKPDSSLGIHLMVDGYGCDQAGLEDMKLIYEFLDEYPHRMDIEKTIPPYVIRHVEEVPEKWGISGLVIVAVGYISVFTFPEKQYVSISMFFCKPFDANVAAEIIKEYFRCNKYEMKVLERVREVTIR
jgi:S-adenosylmethionine decarboxylase